MLIETYQNNLMLDYMKKMIRCDRDKAYVSLFFSSFNVNSNSNNLINKS